MKERGRGESDRCCREEPPGPSGRLHPQKNVPTPSSLPTTEKPSSCREMLPLSPVPKTASVPPRQLQAVNQVKFLHPSADHPGNPYSEIIALFPSAGTPTVKPPALEPRPRLPHQPTRQRYSRTANGPA